MSFLGKAVHIVDVTLLSWQAAVADPILIGVEVLQPLLLLSNACVFCWVANFLCIRRPVLQSSSLVVILTFCITASISLFLFPSPFSLSWSLWSSARSQFWLFSLSGAFRALCKYKEHDPGNFFSPRKGKSSTCQSVILSISSHKGTQSSPCLNPSRGRGRGAGGRGLTLLNNCDQL